MKVTYWHAECLNDSQAYSIREKLKRNAVAAKAAADPEAYGPITKVTVEVEDVFDLLRLALGECGAYWES
jgi:hypothetical protein